MPPEPFVEDCDPPADSFAEVFDRHLERMRCRRGERMVVDESHRRTRTAGRVQLPSWRFAADVSSASASRWGLPVSKCGVRSGTTNPFSSVVIGGSRESSKPRFWISSA